MTDLIIKGAKGIKDGLYVIKDGELFKYKAKGGTVRSYHVTDRPRGEWIEETSWKYKRGGRNSDMKEILGTEWMTMIRQRCSECNKVTMVDGSILYKYCPHCGADMRSE